MKHIRFNPILYIFFCQLRWWLEADCPKHPVFKESYAICNMLSDWSAVNFDAEADDELIFRMHNTLSDLFARDYGDCGFPFNPSSHSYMSETRKWLNIHRCAFVYHYSQRDNWLTKE